METFDVFGKLKRKELSFGLNDVRRVNKREERLLRSALGSIEKQRKRSLLRIQSKFEDLHLSLKETNKVWQEDWKSSGHDENKVQEALRCRVPANHDTKNERFHEFGKENDSPKATISFEETSEQREPSDPGSRAFQRSSFQDNSSNTNKTQRTERLLTRARNTSTGSLLNTLHQNTVNCFQDLWKNAPSNSDVDKMVSRDASSLAISQAISFSDELAVSGRMSQDRIFHYTRPCYRRAVSTGCISLPGKNRPITSPYFSPQVKQKKISADIGSFYISCSKSNSPVPIRKVLGTSRSSCVFLNASDFSPVSRRAVERRTCNSAIGHKKIEKVISCPQLHCSQKETKYRTLWSMNGERSLSRKSTELPGLQTGHEVRNMSKQDEREYCYRCVSPKNLDRTMMDKNLQNRINAFFSSLTENDQVSAGETE